MPLGGPYAPGVTETRRRVVYHLMAAARFDEIDGRSTPIAEDQLARDGFVHCCTREQILEVANWWLTGEGRLVALAFDAAAAGDVRFEVADLGRRYPHVYNPLPRAALLAAYDLGAAPEALPAPLADPPPGFLVAGRRQGSPVELAWLGGRLAGSTEAVLAARALADARAEVRQFPAVTTTAGFGSAYQAFCTFAAVLDEIDDYRGDTFFEPPEVGR